MAKASFGWDEAKHPHYRCRLFAGVREFMSKKTTYTNEPLGKLKIVPDFLPSPEELSFKDETVNVTISLSRSSGGTKARH